MNITTEGKKSSLKKNLPETKKFFPSQEFREKAIISSFEHYKKLYKYSIEQPEKFWSKIASELEWFKSWENVKHSKQLSTTKWFTEAKTNICYNCLDRFLETERRNKAALIWESESGENRVFTYQMLYREVSLFANALKKLGVKKNDHVIIYMGMVPELAIALLACARIGAVHAVVFGGFSSGALKVRIEDAKPKTIITSDVAVKGGANINLKNNVDKALEDFDFVQNVIVHKRVDDANINMIQGRDYWWQEIIQSVDAMCKPAQLDSEHPLFILYTSGTTGKPKGILHSTAGYMVQTYISTKWVFDLKESDIIWTTADIGWITGHTYVVYGPLLNGSTTFMYEGSPNFPDPGRFWQIIEKHRINIFYTTPTAIRAFNKWGDDWIKKYDLSSLRLLGSVGEPISPESWLWYYKAVGKNKCPIVDTWWQTETGTIMISTLPGAIPSKPGSNALPLPGVIPDVVDDEGNSVDKNNDGVLVLRNVFPSMFRNILGDKQRYKEEYWSKVKDAYYTGDGARIDDDGYFWITGRVDDVINVTWHRLGSAEIESAILSHPDVAEAAVVGRPSEVKGSGIVAFVTLKDGKEPSLLLKEELRNHAAEDIGVFAKPDEIRFVDALPKTNSGKIMRRVLREIALENNQ